MGSEASNNQVHDLIRGLQDPAAFPHTVQDLQIIETHISWVILTGVFVYKIKKPVSLGFLDFSTLERRKFFCEEELRLNRRTAPELYLDVVSIGDTPDGLRIGVEPAIEYAVRMRQFPADAPPGSAPRGRPTGPGRHACPGRNACPFPPGPAAA